MTWFQSDLILPMLHRRHMNETMFDNASFQSDYLFGGNAPYDVVDRAIFIHRDFYNKHKDSHDLTVVPVSDILQDVGYKK